MYKYWSPCFQMKGPTYDCVCSFLFVCLSVWQGLASPCFSKQNVKHKMHKIKKIANDKSPKNSYQNIRFDSPKSRILIPKLKSQGFF